MKLEDACFISGPTQVVNEDHFDIISELAQENLDEYITKYQGFIPEEVIMRIFIQILLGVNFIHRSNIDHRDLKPMNILLFNNGEFAKIADFGIARYISSDKTKITKDIGTYKYMSPEA